MAFKFVEMLSLVLLLVTIMVQMSFAQDDDLRHRVIYAVNAGGGDVVGSHGIHYNADPCQAGISSNYGQSKWTFGRENAEDTPLFQTERYSLTTFGYDIPVVEDGDYVLVLYFSEVYFLHAKKKVFNVHLNNIEIISDLDIFHEVGHGIAHEELIPFTISNNLKTLSVFGAQVPTHNRPLRLNFVKGDFDNPKVNAFFVIRGRLEDVPRLAPLPKPEMAEDEDWVPDEDGWDTYQENQGPTAQRNYDLYPEKDWSSYLMVGGTLVGGGMIVIIFKFLI